MRLSDGRRHGGRTQQSESGGDAQNETQTEASLERDHDDCSLKVQRTLNGLNLVAG